MNIDETKNEGAKILNLHDAPSTGLIADALLEVQMSDLAKNSQTEATTQNAQQPQQNNLPEKHWFALRTTYGREKKAYDYIISHQGIAFYPTIVVDKLVNGRIKSCEVSRLPNILFAYGSESEIKRFVYDNVHLPFLRFYYRYFRQNGELMKEPMIVPPRQMETLQIICKAEEQDTIVTTESIQKFQTGQRVRVVNGPFAGVEGRVARYKGQQRVGIEINGFLTAITAYVPSGMMEII